MQQMQQMPQAQQAQQTQNSNYMYQPNAQQQQNQQFNAPEQQSHTNSVQVTLDQESLHIINQTHAELRDSLVSLALKYFAKDQMYFDYFVNKSLLPQEQQEEIQSNLSSQNSNQGPNPREVQQSTSTTPSPAIDLGGGW